MSMEIRSYKDLIFLEQTKLSNYQKELLSQEESLKSLQQELDLKEEYYETKLTDLKKILRQKMLDCKINVENTLKQKNQNLTIIQKTMQIKENKLNLKLIIYKKRLEKLLIAYEQKEVLKLNRLNATFIMCNKNLNALHSDCKKMDIIRNCISKMQKISSINFALTLVMNELFASGHEFNNKDYDYFLKQIEE